jgi:uncharacterized protein YeaO (DUF488 family)
VFASIRKVEAGLLNVGYTEVEVHHCDLRQRKVSFVVRSLSTLEINMAERVLRIKRVYVEPSEDDGERILVDRLWPRGLTKARAKVDLWLKEVAPSNDLRKWFAHDPKKWPEFKRRYVAELKALETPLALLRQETSRGSVTLLYGARDEEHNEAVVLLELLQRK